MYRRSRPPERTSGRCALRVTRQLETSTHRLEFTYDERDAVFEYSYSTTVDGTGVGLAIVKEIAEAHRWDVTLTDSEAGGARFESTGDGSEPLFDG